MDIFQHAISEICRSESGFLIQLNESAHKTKCAQLLIFVLHAENKGIKEEFLMKAALEATTKNYDIFQQIDSIFKQHCSNVGVPDANLSDSISRGLVSASRHRDILKLCVII